MESSCTFGFEDLFWAAHARAWTPLERRALEEATQDARNAIVRSWARTAGDVRLEDRPGTDGAIYTAFQFERPTWWGRLHWRAPMSGLVARGTFGDGEDGGPPADASAPPVDLAGGPVVVAIARTGGPLVPGKAAVVSHGRDVPDAIARVRAALRGLDGAMVHVADADAAAGDLAAWLGDYLRCPVT